VDEGVDQGQYESDVDEAVDRLGADYDAAPYDSHAFPQSAPGQLAAIAYLFGWTRPRLPPRACFNLWHETLLLSPLGPPLVAAA
jgi:hypothetical protein